MEQLSFPSKSQFFVISPHCLGKTITHHPSAEKKTRCFKEHPEHPTAEEIEDAAPGRGSRTKSVELEMDLATGDRFPARKMGVALDRWMVYFRENFDLKRMRTGALPYDSGNLHFKFSKRLAIQKW